MIIFDVQGAIRKFKTETLPRDLIAQMLQAGILAPYAAASVSREDFRRFIVIPRESKATAQIAVIMKRRAEFWSKEMENQMQLDSANS